MPIVSVVVPCYNEEATIGLLLEALYGQDYPRPEMEVIIADGMSSDRTVQVIETFRQSHPELQVRVVSNRQRTISAGLNCAIQAAAGQFIVRLDAHSAPYPDYVRKCMATLENNLAENVGGVWEIRPGKQGWAARSIAAAAAHPLGVGDAHYRFTHRAQQVDTVPFGAFRRALVEQIGGFNESLLTNEDYEFNVRIRNTGGRVWLDPTIRSTYYARSSFRALARQYWRYGFWKARMLRLYPGTLRWRQALPPLFVLSVAGLLGFSPFVPAAPGLLAAELLIYGTALVAASARLAVQKSDLTLLAGVPLAIATMHFAWGTGLIWSLVSSVFMRRLTGKASKPPCT